MNPDDLETKLAKAAQDVSAAKAALTRARDAHQAELRRVEETERDLTDLETKLLATPTDDLKALSALDSKRTGVRVALEVLQRARLPKAEAALAQAQAALEHAELAEEEAEVDVLAERFRAEARKLERLARGFIYGDFPATLLAYEGTAQRLVALGRQPRDPGWLQAAAGARPNGNTRDMLLHTVRVIESADAVAREAAHEQWLKDQRAARGQEDPQEAFIRKALERHAEAEAQARQRAEGSAGPSNTVRDQGERPAVLGKEG